MGQKRILSKRRDQLALVLGHVQLRQNEQQQERQHRHVLMSVSACVALLAKEDREITPAAIAAILDSPMQFPEDEIASALAEMRASGVYDHDVARGVAMRGDATTYVERLQLRIEGDEDRPISSEPTTLPSRSIRLPCAWRGKITSAMPVIASG